MGHFPLSTGFGRSRHVPPAQGFSTEDIQPPKSTSDCGTWEMLKSRCENLTVNGSYILDTPDAQRR